MRTLGGMSIGGKPVRLTRSKVDPPMRFVEVLRALQEERMSEAVKVERAGAIAILRLDDPSALNALSPAIKEGLAAQVPLLLADADVRTIVLTGTGKAFCAGGDIRAMTDPEGRKAPAVRTRMRAAHAWARALLDCDK